MENQTLMPQIAQMLNIELNEEFKIHGMNNIFKLTERGLCDKHNNPCPNVLTALLSGKRTAYIPPFIPTSGDKYFHIALGKKIWETEWTNCPLDYYRLATSNIFKTREKAKEHIDEITELYEALKNGAKLTLIQPQQNNLTK
jgi:hypothetical protein